MPDPDVLTLPELTALPRVGRKTAFRDAMLAEQMAWKARRLPHILPFGASPEARAVLADFLRARTDLHVARVRAVVLEYALPAPHDPGTLLGEYNGTRGANQTSPDVAFEVTLDDGRADVRTDWGPMFVGRASFTVWSHQAWFRWVAEAAHAPPWTADWLAWVGDPIRLLLEGREPQVRDCTSFALAHGDP